MRIAFVTNICAHYRVKTFETLAKYFDVDFIFFSIGEERYWDQRHGVRLGKFNGSYLKGARVAGIRITPSLISKLFNEDYDVIIKCITGRFALPVTYLITRVKRRPFILWTNLWYHPDTIFHKVTFPIARWIYLHADAIVVFGSHIKEYLIRIGVDASKIFVTTQAVDEEVFGGKVTLGELESLRKKLGVRAPKIILYVGRFDPIKGLDYLIEAFEILSQEENVQLLLVGEGQEKDRIKKLVWQKGLGKKVFFENYVENRELYRYYALANVLVLPSITLRRVKEVWGLVINEAMNQGCPVVTTNAVGAAAGGLVIHEVTGLIVPERNPYELAMALKKITSDSNLEQSMRDAALTAVKSWTYERQVDGFRQAICYVMRTRVQNARKS